MSILNEPLRKQIYFHLHKALLEKVTILTRCTSTEQAFFITRLKPVLFLKDDIIMREGEKGDYMYFIQKGEVDVLLKIGKEAGHIRLEAFKVI